MQWTDGLEIHPTEVFTTLARLIASHGRLCGRENAYFSIGDLPFSIPSFVVTNTLERLAFGRGLAENAARFGRLPPSPVIGPAAYSCTTNSVF
jgi:hypothetical protein